MGSANTYIFPSSGWTYVDGELVYVEPYPWTAYAKAFGILAASVAAWAVLIGFLVLLYLLLSYVGGSIVHALQSLVASVL